MAQVFITKSHLENIARLISYQSIDVNHIRGFYESRFLGFFSTPELNTLTAVSLVLESIKDEELKIKIITLHDNAKARIEKYNKNENSRWIYVGSKPAYHHDEKCISLYSTYENYEIPVEIPEDKIKDYRTFFLNNIDEYTNKRDVFFAKVELKFNVRINNVKEVHKENSGRQSLNVFTGGHKQILSEISNIIEEMHKYKNQSNEVKRIISNTGFNTKKALKHPLYNESHEIIREWDNYKTKLKDLIIQDLTSIIAPEYKFDHDFLEELGFKKCSECF